jgi:hypothetical protein
MQGFGYYMLKLHFTPASQADMFLDLDKGGKFLEQLERLPVTLAETRNRGAWAPNVDMGSGYAWHYLMFAEEGAVPALKAAIKAFSEVSDATIEPATSGEVSSYQKRLAGQRELAEKWIVDPSLSVISTLPQPIHQIIVSGFRPWIEELFQNR